MSFCLHIAGVTCDNCRHLVEPQHLDAMPTVSSTGTGHLTFVAFDAQKAWDRAFIEKIIDLLSAHPDLRQQMRQVLEVPPLQGMKP